MLKNIIKEVITILIDIMNIHNKCPHYELTLYKNTGEILGFIPEAFDIIYSANLTSPDELTFSLPFYLDDKTINPNFEKVKGKLLLRLEQVLEGGTVILDKFFIITKANRQGNDNYIKNIECKSREHLLAGRNLKNFKGVKKIYRTTAEIAAFEPSELYSSEEEFVNSGILNHVISLCPSWSIGIIDEELNSKFRDIQIDTKSILDFLNNDCPMMFGGLFVYDTINMAISFKKVESIGINRGLFITEENFIKVYGEDIDFDECVTKLTLTGKSGLGINSVNLGGGSILDLSYYKTLDHMNQDLIDAIDNYTALVSSKESEFEDLLEDLNTNTSLLATKTDELDIMNAALLLLEDTKDALIQQGESLTSINAEINAKLSEITTKQSEIDAVETSITTINNSINSLKNEIDMTNPLNFTSEQLILLDQFIIEKEFNEPSFIDATELKNEGLSILSRINQPPIQVSLDVISFLDVVDAQYTWNLFRLGDIINIQYSKFNINIELRLINFVHSPFDNSLQLTFSNKSKINDPNMLLQDILQNAISTNTTLNTNRSIYGQYVESGEQSQLLSYINSELDLAAQKAKAGKNQNIEIGPSGISCKDTTLSGEEIRILNNLIALTTDNWNTADVAITPQGINAKVIRGILGEFCTVRANQLIVGDEGETIPESLIENASLWNGTTTNFNNRNDRKSTTPANPTITLNGTAIDHTLNTDGSANISFEWNFSGTGDAYDIDGFFIYIYQSSSSSAYTFGTSVANETIYMLSADKRAFLLYGVPANMYYTFGVQAFRYVDTDINANNILKSSIIKSTYSGENPYRPSSSIAFAGDVTGTINGVAASTLQTQAGNSVQRDTLYNKVKISTTGGIQILDASNNERYKAGDLGSGRYGWYLKDSAGNIRVLTRSDGTLQLINGEFILYDGSGNERCRFGDLGSGQYGFYIKDSSGNIRVLTKSDGTLQIINGEVIINDGSGTERVRIGQIGTEYGIKATHTDGSYTQLTEQGLKRYVSGTGYDYSYMFYVGTGTGAVGYVEGYSDNRPIPVTVTLPSHFQGKNFKVTVSMRQFEGDSANRLSRIWCKVNSVNQTAGTFTVYSNVAAWYGEYSYYHYGADFIYIAQY